MTPKGNSTESSQATETNVAKPRVTAHDDGPGQVSKVYHVNVYYYYVGVTVGRSAGYTDS